METFHVFTAGKVTGTNREVEAVVAASFAARAVASNCSMKISASIAVPPWFEGRPWCFVARRPALVSLLFRHTSCAMRVDRLAEGGGKSVMGEDLAFPPPALGEGSHRDLFLPA
jgi:hypothetical protein